MDVKKLEYRGEAALKELDNLTAEADQVQENILKEILKQNGGTEYLNKYLQGCTEVSAFKNRVPLTTYEEIRPYIKRIAKGEPSSVLSGQTITEMICSSGTSAGEPKMMPSIEEDLDRRTYVFNLIMPILNRYIPGLDKGKAMYLYFAKAEMSTPSGLPARTVLTSYYKSKHFKCRSPVSFDLTSPDQVILCTDSHQSMYCQLLSGLLHRHQVLQLGAVFASAFLRAISFLERNWSQLCDDICTGELSSTITDPACRSAMSEILKSPNPQLADEIRMICNRKQWNGVLCQLWPKAKYIEAVLTGTMAQYIPALEFYSAGKLHLVSAMYASSECFFGVNLKPLCDPADVAYTLLPNMAYFEFIPLGDNELTLPPEDEEVPRNKPVGLTHVRLGCYYELVVTTFAGLNRYRIGDVLQVVGFHNRVPQLRFICRRNVLLSIDNDRTTEEDLHNSITLAKKLLEPYSALLVEYTSYADTSSAPGHYVLYWEIQHYASTNGASNPLNTHVFEDCCITVEDALDYVYRRGRAYDKSVGPLEIRIVKPGTFEALMDHFIKNGSSINQYKTPRAIKSSAALDLLNSRVEACFFSPRDPTWIP